jgi:hypothetical protein
MRMVFPSSTSNDLPSIVTLTVFLSILILLYLPYFSPPLAGGDEGEGDKFFLTPTLYPPPSRGRVLD